MTKQTNAKRRTDPTSPRIYLLYYPPRISTTHHHRRASPASHSVAPVAPPPIHPPDWHSRRCSVCRGRWHQTSRPSSCSPRYLAAQAAGPACGRPCWAVWLGGREEPAWPLRWWRRRWRRGWGWRGARPVGEEVRLLVLRLLVPRGRLPGSSLGWKLSCSCRATSLDTVRCDVPCEALVGLTVSFL